MSRVEDLLTRCRELGANLIPTQEGKLRVTAPAPLLDELREALRMNKQAILATLTRPYINTQGELIIPCTADRRYHWWAGGQSLAQTLAELNAPPDVWRRYVAGYTQTMH